MNAKGRELHRLRRLLRRVYPYVVEVPGTEELQADLELEVLRIARLALVRSYRKEGQAVH